VALSALTSTILMFVGIVCVGALLRATGVVHSGDARPLNAVIIYAGLPAFIFRAVHGARLTGDLFAVVGVAWALCLSLIALAWVAARLLKLPREVAGGFILATAWANTGFLGYPVTEALLGTKALPTVVFSDVFGTVLTILSLGVLIARHYGSAEDAPKANPLIEIATFPAVVALVAALALRGVEVTPAISHGIDVLANMVAPLIMLSVGIALRPHALRRYALPLGVLAVLRLAVAPVVALAFGALFLRGLPLQAAVLEASMPAMMLTLVIGGRFEVDTDFLASAIFVTTALAALTVPLVQLIAF
jgi:predicted permease